MDAPINLEAAIDWFLQCMKVERGLSKNTLSAYARDLQQFVSFLKVHFDTFISHYSEISDRHVLLYVQHLIETRGFSTRSVARMASAIRGLFRFLREEQVLSQSTVPVVSLPKASKAHPSVLSLEQVDALLSSSPCGYASWVPGYCHDRATRLLALNKKFANGMNLRSKEECYGNKWNGSKRMIFEEKRE